MRAALVFIVPEPRWLQSAGPPPWSESSQPAVRRAISGAWSAPPSGGLREGRPAARPSWLRWRRPCWRRARPGAIVPVGAGGLGPAPYAAASPPETAPPDGEAWDQ